MNREGDIFLTDIIRTLIMKLSEGEDIIALDRTKFEHLFLFSLQGVNIIKNIISKINEIFDYPEDSEGWKYVLGEELSLIIEEHLQMEGLGKN